MFMHPGMYQRPMPYHQMPGFPMNIGAVPERPGMMPSMPSSAQPQVPLQQTGPPMSMMIPQGPHALMDPRLMQMSGGGMMGGPYGGGYGGGMPGMPGMGMGIGMGGMHPGMYAHDGGMYAGGGGMMPQSGDVEMAGARKPTVRFDETHRAPAGASHQTSTASTPAQTAGLNPYGFGMQQGTGPSYSSHLSSGNPLAYGNHGYSNGYASPASPSAAHSYPNTPGWSGGYDARSDPFAMQETASADHGAGGEVAHHAQRPPRQGKRSWYAPRQAMTR